MAIYRYERDPQAIYREFFARIEEEAGPALAALSPDLARLAVRLIHACGMTDLIEDLVATPDIIAASRKALRDGAPIFAMPPWWHRASCGVTCRRMSRSLPRSICRV